MHIISHRGNLYGPSSEIPRIDNHPKNILNAIEMGFDVEIDVWKIKDDLFLGHDQGKHLVNQDFFITHIDRLFVHCKNFEALVHFSGTRVHHFWHENDSWTLTSKSVIWTYPGREVCEKSILVLRESWGEPDFSIYNDPVKPYAICTDYPVAHREHNEHT